jgi:hypothetical protein
VSGEQVQVVLGDHDAIVGTARLMAVEGPR